jgi:hypothetical protein
MAGQAGHDSEECLNIMAHKALYGAFGDIRSVALLVALLNE